MDKERINIVFLDDCKSLNKIFEGYFNHHKLAETAQLKTVKSPVDLFMLMDQEDFKIDYLVLDYHLCSCDGLDIAELVKYKQPQAVVWMYTGMSEKYIFDNRKELIDRYFHKDLGIPHVLDQLYNTINQNI